MGRHLVGRLVSDGHAVVAGVYGEEESASLPGIETIRGDLRDQQAVEKMVASKPEGVVHLAAVSSGTEARGAPLVAWDVNVLGTLRLLEAFVIAGRPVRILVVSTAEVYAPSAADLPIGDDAPLGPRSPYAASKLAAELAGTDAAIRSDLEIIIVRPFGHTGPGQDTRFVVPAFAERIRMARAKGFAAVPVGNVDVVREFMHVADVVDAYVRLLTLERPDASYNVASGVGHRLLDVFHMVADSIGHRVVPEVDGSLVRSNDIPYLVGDAERLRRDTGWNPTHTFEHTVREVVDAQTH